MTSFVTAKYDQEKNQVLDPNSVGTPVTAEFNPIAGVVVNLIVNLTQAAYDAIGTKDANTLYVIVG